MPEHSDKQSDKQPDQPDDGFEVADLETTSTDRERDARTGRAAARNRIAQQQTWVDHQLRVAMERGDFDDLPGAGKPIEGLGESHDPDWWLKRLVEREQIAVLPPSLQLRKDDAELDAALDRHAREADVRRDVEDFNARVMRARYSPQEGQPPLVTMPRDVDVTVQAWRERREARRPVVERETPAPPRRRWWSRSRR